MEKLNELWNLPMLWNIIIPVVVVFGCVAFLVWDSTNHLPLEKRIMHRLRETRKARKAQKHTQHT